MRLVIALFLAIYSFALTGCDSTKKANYVGRWISKDGVVVRTLVLDSKGNGSLKVTPTFGSDTVSGKWDVLNDILFLDYEGGKTIYLRVVRISGEKLVIRNEEGTERIYDRLQ
jgi:hypothetical protein